MNDGLPPKLDVPVQGVSDASASTDPVAANDTSDGAPHINVDEQHADSTKVTEHRDGVLSASSHSSDRPVVYNHGRFDIAVLFSSWDARCLNPTRTALRADRAFLVLFDDHGTSGRRATHDAALRTFASENSARIDEVTGSSTDLYPIWNELADHINEHAASRQRPLSVYIDLSAASRFYALGAVAHALRVHAAYLEVTYSEAHYQDAQPDNEHEMFTIGTWKTVAIPGLEGKWDPEQRRSWLITLGFEGTKTFRAASTADPDRLAVMVPDPAVRADYVERTLRQNADLLREYAVTSQLTVTASAGDAVAAWQKAEAFLPIFEEDNINLVCAGTKPHALAMTLLSVANERSAVLYLKPDRHKESPTTPTDQHWTYIIRNHASV